MEKRVIDLEKERLMRVKTNSIFGEKSLYNGVLLDGA